MSLLIAGACWAGAARAEHYDITLTVEGDKEKQEAFADDSPPPEGLKARPVFHGAAKEPLIFQFFMTDVNPHEILKQVKVRYYLAPMARAGQKDLPSLEKGVVLQGEFLVDFKPKSRVGLRQQFQIERPGIYLLRVESAHSHSDHEHFSAIDLEIKER